MSTVGPSAPKPPIDQNFFPEDVQEVVDALGEAAELEARLSQQLSDFFEAELRAADVTIAECLLEVNRFISERLQPETVRLASQQNRLKVFVAQALGDAQSVAESLGCDLSLSQRIRILSLLDEPTQAEVVELEAAGFFTPPLAGDAVELVTPGAAPLSGVDGVVDVSEPGVTPFSPVATEAATPPTAFFPPEGDTVDSLASPLIPEGISTAPTVTGVEEVLAVTGQPCQICDTQHDIHVSCPEGSVTLQSDEQRPPIVLNFGGDIVDVSTRIDPTIILEADREKGFCAWFQIDENACYVQTRGEKPRTPTDILIGCGETQTEAATMAASACSSTPAIAFATGSLPEFTKGSDFCNINFYQAFSGEKTTGLPLGVDIGTGFLIANPFGQIANVVIGTINAIIQSTGKEDFTEQVVQIVGTILNQFLDWTLKGFDCDTRKILPVIVPRIILDFLGQWIGPAFSDFAMPYAQAQRASCPTLFPNSQEATSAWLGNQIDSATFKNWAELNNQCWEPWTKFAQSQKATLSTIELAFATRRKLIDASTYRDKMREKGFLDADAIAANFNLTEAIPPIQDLIRMMVRDVGDEDLVKRFGLDDEFEKKWTGQVKEWGAFQGVSDEIAKLNWRAHWRIPAPNQLFEMFHRLRFLPEDNPAHVSLEDIETALIQQDILPFWIPKFLAISFRPLSRVDARRAFTIGSINREEFKKAYLDLGYSDDNAEILTQFGESLKQRSIPSALPTRLFRNGTITRIEATQRLEKVGGDADTITQTLDDVQRLKIMKRGFRLYKSGTLSLVKVKEFFNREGVPEELTIETLDDITQSKRSKSNKICVDAVEDRFLGGELTAAEVPAELQKFDVELEEADELLRGWECKKSARGKTPTTAMLCDMFIKGSIDRVEYQRRLLNIGWSDDDAFFLVARCMEAQGETLAKKAKRVRDNQEKELKREQQMADKARREIDKLNREGKKLATAATKLRDKRIKAKLKVADKLRDTSEFTLEESADIVNDAWRLVRDNYNFNQPQIIQVLVVAVEDRSPNDPREFLLQVGESAESVASLAFV